MTTRYSFFWNHSRAVYEILDTVADTTVAEVDTWDEARALAAAYNSKATPLTASAR